MLITLFTDVSHDHRTGIGAYAWWAKVNGIAYRQAGLFRDRINNNNLAEVCGLVNGLYGAITKIEPPSGAKFIAQSDSGIAIAALKGGSGGAKYDTIRRAVDAKLAQRELIVEYRHVQAHKGNVTPRNAVNSWCDRTARALMRSRRDQMMIPQNASLLDLPLLDPLK
jgi:ribonuclease HI